MMTLEKTRQSLRKQADPPKAALLQRYFKTGPGEYGEGDRFIGVVVPQIREVARNAKGLALKDVARLISSPIHEERLLGLLLLVSAFEDGGPSVQSQIVPIYLKYLKKGHINNWDLIDLSCHEILGPYLLNGPKDILFKLARSKNLWERRVAIITTAHFIKREQYGDALALARILVRDEEDLIQKAVGWMLREVGNRDLKAEEKFLKVHYKSMPRTMLRYAIEKFPESRRQAYLQGKA